MIWGPFVLALVLGLLVSAGLYYAYLWPQVEPDEPDEPDDDVDRVADPKPASKADEAKA